MYLALHGAWCIFHLKDKKVSLLVSLSLNQKGWMILHLVNWQLTSFYFKAQNHTVYMHSLEDLSGHL